MSIFYIQFVTKPVKVSTGRGRRPVNMVYTGVSNIRPGDQNRLRSGSLTVLKKVKILDNVFHYLLWKSQILTVGPQSVCLCECGQYGGPGEEQLRLAGFLINTNKPGRVNWKISHPRAPSRQTTERPSSPAQMLTVGRSRRAETVIWVGMRALWVSAGSVEAAAERLRAVGLWDCVRLKGDPAQGRETQQLPLTAGAHR